MIACQKIYVIFPWRLVFCDSFHFLDMLLECGRLRATNEHSLVEIAYNDRFHCRAVNRISGVLAAEIQSFRAVLLNRLYCVHGRNGCDNTQSPISFTTLAVIYKGERRVVQVRVVLKQMFLEQK